MASITKGPHPYALRLASILQLLEDFTVVFFSCIGCNEKMNEVLEFLRCFVTITCWMIHIELITYRTKTGESE